MSLASIQRQQKRDSTRGSCLAGGLGGMNRQRTDGFYRNGTFIKSPPKPPSLQDLHRERTHGKRYI